LTAKSEKRKAKSEKRKAKSEKRFRSCLILRIGGQPEMAVPLEKFFAAPLGLWDIFYDLLPQHWACWAKFFGSPPGLGSACVWALAAHRSGTA
jgi:hypothetical protein